MRNTAVCTRARVRTHTHTHTHREREREREREARAHAYAFGACGYILINARTRLYLHAGLFANKCAYRDRGRRG